MPLLRWFEDDDTPVMHLRRYATVGQSVLGRVGKYHTLEKASTKFPPGVYLCSRDRFHRGGYDTFLVHVPGRERILFHIGNTPADTEGCPLVGYGAHLFDGCVLGITRSRDGFNDWFAELRGLEVFTLVVTES